MVCNKISEYRGVSSPRPPWSFIERDLSLDYEYSNISAPSIVGYLPSSIGVYLPSLKVVRRHFVAAIILKVLDQEVRSLLSPRFLFCIYIVQLDHQVKRIHTLNP